MVYITNLFYLPLLMMIWIIELYLFLAFARLVMTKIPSASQSQLYRQFKLLTDFVPETLGQKLAMRKGKSLPSWLSWLIFIASASMIRQILIVIITM